MYWIFPFFLGAIFSQESVQRITIRIKTFLMFSSFSFSLLKWFVLSFLNINNSSTYLCTQLFWFSSWDKFELKPFVGMITPQHRSKTKQQILTFPKPNNIKKTQVIPYFISKTWQKQIQQKIPTFSKTSFSDKSPFFIFM